MNAATSPPPNGPVSSRISGWPSGFDASASATERSCSASPGNGYRWTDGDVLEIGEVLGSEATVPVRQGGDGDRGGGVSRLRGSPSRMMAIHSRTISTLVRPDRLLRQELHVAARDRACRRTTSAAPRADADGSFITSYHATASLCSSWLAIALQNTACDRQRAAAVPRGVPVAVVGVESRCGARSARCTCPSARRDRPCPQSRQVRLVRRPVGMAWRRWSDEGRELQVEPHDVGAHPPDFAEGLDEPVEVIVPEGLGDGRRGVACPKA